MVKPQYRITFRKQYYRKVAIRGLFRYTENIRIYVDGKRNPNWYIKMPIMGEGIWVHIGTSQYYYDLPRKDALQFAKYEFIRLLNKKKHQKKIVQGG